MSESPPQAITGFFIVQIPEKNLHYLTIDVNKLQLMTMFKPTHLLVSRSRTNPVQLFKSPEGFYLVTETEWQKRSQPSFEIRSKRGFFCQGVPLLGYSLKPLNIQAKNSQTQLPLLPSVPNAAEKI